jgi:periplasmic protein CpxP/Spy
MKSIGFQFAQRGARLVVAAVFASTLAFSPCFALAADKVAHVERTEQRIADMHGKLKITAAQEELWGKVAMVMTDNAKAMDTLTQARIDHAKGATAVDDLKSYGEITEAHADGIRKLIPVFTTLYASMSDPQKVEADTLFRHGDRRHGGHKHRHDSKKPDAK